MPDGGHCFRYRPRDSGYRSHAVHRLRLLRGCLPLRSHYRCVGGLICLLANHAQMTTDITRIYAPASTSAGLYQYTRSTFEDARRFCIHNHRVSLKKPFPNLSGCWFNALYSRFCPSHAIEMTSARLDYYLRAVLKRSARQNVSLEDKHRLAAVMHLCGVTKGERFARGGFRFSALPTCGTHQTASYYARIKRAQGALSSATMSFFERIF